MDQKWGEYRVIETFSHYLELWKGGGKVKSTLLEADSPTSTLVAAAAAMWQVA